MTELGQGLFYFFIAELSSFILAALIKDEKARIRFLVVGTIVSGMIGFVLPQPPSPQPPVSTKSPTVESASSGSSRSSSATSASGALDVTLVNGSGITPYLDFAKTLGELADESYSLEQRNQVNRVLTFTVSLKPAQPAIWRWYWCATTKDLLDANLDSIGLKFVLNGSDISERFSARYFPFTEAPMKGWTCYTYEVVLRDWDVGTHHLEQITTIYDEIYDGQNSFLAGYKIYEYTVSVR